MGKGNAFAGIVMLIIIRGIVEGAPAEDFVERLPGQPRVEFKQYAGYVTVDRRAGRALFYYFVEAQKHSHAKPLTLWFNGGPGCSSIGGGAFTELGPFYPRGDGRGLVKNSQSWNKASNILFIESPAGVGWSYSNTSSDYTCGDASAARDMQVFLLKWFEKFPEYRSRDLFVTGESYAGHYVPQLVDLLIDYNKREKGFNFNIKGIAIGNPLLKLGVDAAASWEYLWSHGLTSDETNTVILHHCDFDDYVLNGPNQTVSTECNVAMIEANKEVGDYINQYDVVLDVCYPSLVEQELRLGKQITKISLGVDVCMTYERRFYFNLPEVQNALHANRTKLPYDWSMCSGLLNYSSADGSIDILPVLKRIIQHGIRVWVFSDPRSAVLSKLSGLDSALVSLIAACSQYKAGKTSQFSYKSFVMFLIFALHNMDNTLLPVLFTASGKRSFKISWLCSVEKSNCQLKFAVETKMQLCHFWGQEH